MKDVLIIAHFIRDTIEGRFEYLANKLVDAGYNVELVTTDFSHQLKKEKNIEKHQLKEFKFNLTMIHEPGYSNNISLRRFYSHYIIGISLKKYLKERRKPDVIYCAVPSLDVAKVSAEYAKMNNIFFIVDIQDLWPEAFKMVLNLPVISNILFYPMLKRADFIYAAADEIVGVSQTYVDRALMVNKNSKYGHSVFLGTELSVFDKLSKEKKIIYKPKNEIWVAYIGTLGYSYNLTSVLDALNILKNRQIKHIKFIVMGDGPLKHKFEGYAKSQNVWAEFTGKLEYRKMVGILTSCDIAVNPIKAGSAGSIINKVGDYAAAGLPVINTQECMEYRNLIDKYQAGFNCISDNPSDIADRLYELVKNQKIREEMGRNNRRLAEDKFDREKTYKEIIDLIKYIKI